MTELDRRTLLVGVGSLALAAAAPGKLPDTVGVSDNLDAHVVNAPTPLADTVQFSTDYLVRKIDVDGITVLDEQHFHNAVTTGAKNLIDTFVYTNGTAAAFTACDMGLIGASPTLAPTTDTIASHPGWTEVASGYAARLAPTFGAVASGTINTSSSVNFVATGGGFTAAGAFLVRNGSTTIADTTGLLTNEGTFTAAQTLTSGQTLQVSQGITLTEGDGFVELPAYA